jgi:carboxyl-terminal processing protease
MSKRVLDTYIDMLDFSRIYFTKEDVEGFRSKYELSIDDHVRTQSIPAAYEIYSVYEERIRSRVAMAKELAKQGKFTYDSDRTVEISRKDADWVPAGKSHDQLWKNLIESDLLREKMIADALAEEEAKEAEERKKNGEPPKKKDSDGKPEKSIYEKVSERYDRILKRVKENNTISGSE